MSETKKSTANENGTVEESKKENTRKYLEKYDELVEYMLSQSSSQERSILKTCLGIPVSRAAMEALISFCKVSYGTKGGYWTEKLEAMFFTACMIAKYDIKEAGNVPIEQILKNMYKAKNVTDSTKHKIEDMLNTRMDERACNLKKLAALLSIINKEEVKKVDLAKLMYDLYNWDSYELLKSSKVKWAQTIIS